MSLIQRYRQNELSFCSIKWCPLFRGSFQRFTVSENEREELINIIFSLSNNRKKKSGKNKSSGGKEKPGASPSDYDTRSMDGDLEEEGEREGERGERAVHTPDGYDSNDELLATIAKV